MAGHRRGTPWAGPRARRACRTRSTPNASRTGSSLSVLQLLEAPGPVLLEQPGKAAVGEEPPARLADGTVVGLVVGVPDPLHRSAAPRAGFPVATVDRHAASERGHLLRKAVPRLLPQAVGPFRQHHHGGVVQPRHLFVYQPAGELQRRELRAVQNLVGVRITDPAEEPGIGQGALEGMTLQPEPLGKLDQPDLEWLQP